MVEWAMGLLARKRRGRGCESVSFARHRERSREYAFRETYCMSGHGAWVWDGDMGGVC